MIYLVSFLVSIFFSIYLAKLIRKNNSSIITGNYRFKRNILFILAIFPVWFISAFRYNVGTDYFSTYVTFFGYIQLGSKPYDEPLFQLLNEILVFLNLNYIWFFIVTSTIIITGIYFMIFKYSKKPILSVVIFFVSGIFFHSLNNVRQYVALIFAFLAFFQKNNIKSLILLIVGSLLHYSVCLLILVYFFRNIKFDKIKFILISSVLIIATPFVAGFIPEILAKTKYAYFINNFKVGDYSTLIILVNFLIFFITIIYYDKNDTIYRVMSMLQLLTVIFCIFSIILPNEELWVRTIRIPMFCHIFLIPKIIENEKNKTKRYLLTYFLVLVFSVYTIYTVVLMGGQDVFPYQLYFLK